MRAPRSKAPRSRLAPGFVRVDTTATSQLEDWLESIGLPQVGDATTMVRGLDLEIQLTGPAHMFALANQSFNY
jgi:hypothetical protein